MTDKEKQYLKAKIGELREEAFDKNMDFLSSYHEGGYNALCKVENIIASMQEEPVSDDTMTIRKDWFEQCKKSWYNEGYLDGKHNRDGQFGEPVSDECIYNRTLEERKRSCKFCSAACQVRIKEEPVSEELEEASRNYTDNEEYGDDVYFSIKAAFKAGAKWLKEKMIKDAVDAECDVILLEEGDELQYSVLYPKGKKPFNKGDKVKLIIVKED